MPTRNASQTRTKARRGPTRSAAPTLTRATRRHPPGGRSRADRTPTRATRTPRRHRSRRTARTPRRLAPPRRRARPPFPDALAALAADHAVLRQLLRRLARSGEAEQRRRLFDQVDEGLALHMRLEEELLDPAYHAVAAAKDDVLYHEGKEEHASIHRLLARLRRQDSATPTFAAQARLLRDQVERHARQEEGRLFPRARRLLPAAQLQALAEGMRRRRDELLGLDERTGLAVWQTFARQTEWGHVPPLA